MSKKKILVSACLLGELVRYDGELLADCPPILKEWQKAGLVIPVCPEVDGGLPTPRLPSEIQDGDGKDVVAGTSKVVDINGKDVTAAFLKGAREALRMAEENEVKIAILKERSPSCGSKLTYDGTFSNSLIAGQGVAAALLENNGIRVYNEDEIDQITDLID
ncbi:MAG: DUF523 domain-containing protein [Anaerolineales bacterium]|jgi:uncharacterized protein YbbK (DUF523 family)